MKQFYKDTRFYDDSLVLIETINGILAEYEGRFSITVRSLYYQLVARDIIPNTEQSYKRITSMVNNAKMAGLIDWDSLEDRTRAFIRKSKWNSGSELLNICARTYHQDMWDNQDVRVFAVVEKDALVGVLEGVCRELDIPLLAARGYPSSTVLREFTESDIIAASSNGQDVHILHLGDHDPSGIDMSRDLEERFRLFAGDDEYSITFQRIALNMDQIHEQKPPKNPAKNTDSRFADYRKKFGVSSWELDALKPDYLAELVRTNAWEHIDIDKWEENIARIDAVREKLSSVAAQFDADLDDGA